MFPFIVPFAFLLLVFLKCLITIFIILVFDLLSIGFHNGLEAKVLLNVTQNKNFKVFI